MATINIGIYTKHMLTVAEKKAPWITSYNRHTNFHHCSATQSLLNQDTGLPFTHCWGIRQTRDPGDAATHTGYMNNLSTKTWGTVLTTPQPSSRRGNNLSSYSAEQIFTRLPDSINATGSDRPKAHPGQILCNMCNTEILGIGPGKQGYTQQH